MSLAAFLAAAPCCRRLLEHRPDQSSAPNRFLKTISVMTRAANNNNKAPAEKPATTRHYHSKYLQKASYKVWKLFGQSQQVQQKPVSARRHGSQLMLKLGLEDLLKDQLNAAAIVDLRAQRWCDNRKGWSAAPRSALLFRPLLFFWAVGQC